MRRGTWVVLIVVVIGGLVAYLSQFGMPFVAPIPVQVPVPEYRAQGALLRVYTGPRAPDTRWLLLGTTDPAVRVVVEAPPARGIYKTPGFSSVQNDGPFTVRIDRKVLGFIWVPDMSVEFTVPANQMPAYTSENAAQLEAEFKAALNTAGK